MEQLLIISSQSYNAYDDVLHFRTPAYKGRPAYAKEPEAGIYMLYDLEDDELVAITVMEAKQRKDMLFPVFESLGLPTIALSTLN